MLGEGGKRIYIGENLKDGLNMLLWENSHHRCELKAGGWLSH